MTVAPRSARVASVAMVVLLTVVGLALAAGGTATARTPDAGALASAKVPKGLRVSGNQLLDSAGHPVVLRGVNRSGTEYACVQNLGIFDGPHDDASIAAMASWHINAVRVPLNEDCWLGINGVAKTYSGKAYQSAIRGYVKQLHAAGLVAILDLHWTAAGTAQATGPQDMPDADHAPKFWTSVAKAFKSDSSTVFDLFNEPHDVSWTCWRDGTGCDLGYQAAGMQTLVSAVRATKATNPVLVGGLAYANDLSQWLTYEPMDRAGNLMASWHSYNFNACSSTSCWDQQVAPVAASVPLVAGEIGENDCAHGYLDSLLPWLDGHGAGYLGWEWNTADCGGNKSGPSLISSYDGTPTPYGVGLRDHLAALAGGGGGGGGSSASLPVSTSVDASSAPYYWEEDLDLTPSDTITALTVTVTVPRTSPGMAYHGDYDTATTGFLSHSHTTSATTLTYTTTLNPGQVVKPGELRDGVLRIADQFDGDGSPHDTSADTYAVVATVGGQQVSESGHF